MIKRTPPPSPAMPTPMERQTGSPNMDCCQNVTQRKKPDSTTQMNLFMSEMREMFNELKNQQKADFTILSSALTEVKTQNAEIQKSIEFLSKKYDDIVSEVSTLKGDMDKNTKLIQNLETKLEYMERSALISTVEIRNVPKSLNETKSTLLEYVQKTGKIINCPAEKPDIRNIYRQKKNTESGSIVVDFTTNTKKEEFMQQARNYNKSNPTAKLNTTHLDIVGPVKPVYIGERLTYQTNKIFYMARELTKERNYHHCWTYNGQVYLRKKDGDRPLRIKNEEDIVHLKNTK